MADSHDRDTPWTARRHWSQTAGDALRAARHRRGWSLRNAARHLSVSRSHLADLEAARRVPSTTVAETLIAGYELDAGTAQLLRDTAVAGVGRDFPGPAS